MASLNKVLIIGNLGKDIELRWTQNGKAIAPMTVATETKWTDAAGVQKSLTEWHRVVVWGKQAENCAKYLKKGQLVFVEGRLQTRKYEKNGVDHYATEIKAENVQFLSIKPSDEVLPQSARISQEDFEASTECPF